MSKFPMLGWNTYYGNSNFFENIQFGPETTLLGKMDQTSKKLHGMLFLYMITAARVQFAPTGIILVTYSGKVLRKEDRQGRDGKNDSPHCRKYFGKI